MTRNDLKDYNISQKWVNARICFLEEQIKNVGKLNSIISDMPKGSRIIQDEEAESVVKLIDQINNLKRDLKKELLDKEQKIKQQLNKLNSKHGLLLYHYYILGHSIKYIAKEVLYYREKYVYDLKQEALDEFDKIGKNQ